MITADLPGPLAAALTLSAAALTLGAALPLYRLVRGPTLPDRAVALDTLSAMLAGLLILLSAMTGRVLFMSVALLVAAVLFVGTVAFAAYVQRRVSR